MTGFLLGACTPCDDEVLGTRDLDAHGTIILRCIHCDAVLDPTTLRRAGPAELSELGYVVDKSMESNGKRGCRDGHCGVRQPD